MLWHKLYLFRRFPVTTVKNAFTCRAGSGVMDRVLEFRLAADPDIKGRFPVTTVKNAFT